MAGKLIACKKKSRVFSQTGPPFVYRNGKTSLHRARAGLKLLFVIVLSLAAYTSVYGLVFTFFFLIIACITARIRLPELLKGSKPVMILSFFIILFKIFFSPNYLIHLPLDGKNIGFAIPYTTLNLQGFLEGIITALRIIVSFSTAALFFSVTTMRELRRSLSVIEMKLRGKSTKTAFFSLGISLMLGFIPRFFELWEILNTACEARSCKRGLRRLFILLPLITERMMETAAETAVALESRGLVDDYD